MKKYPDFFSVVIGKSPGFLLGYIVLAAICALAIIFIDAAGRDVQSARTPVKFSIRFWLADNLARLFANLLLIPIAIRMCYEYVSPVWMLALSCGIGFGVDGLALIAKNYGILTTKKLAEKMNAKLSNL
jgi:hypothetical protein